MFCASNISRRANILSHSCTSVPLASFAICMLPRACMSTVLNNTTENNQPASLSTDNDYIKTQTSYYSSLNPKENRRREILTRDMFNAVNADNIPKMRDLLNRKAPATFDYTPLHFAASANMVDKLLKHGADIEARDRRHFTPLMAAVRYQTIDVVQALVSAKADVNANNASGEHSLLAAVVRGDLAMTKLLIDAKADIECTDAYSGKTGLFIATERNNIPLVKLLIDNKSDVNKVSATGMSVYNLAKTFKYDHIVDILVAAGANETPNRSYSILAESVMFGSYRKVLNLLENNADPNCVDKYGQPAFVSCTSNGDMRVMTLLVHHNADVNVVDQNGRTALWKAVSKRSRAHFINPLISLKADVNVPDRYGVTPLMIAAKNGSLSIVDELLAAGANVQAYDIRGSHAAVFAIKNNHREVHDRLKAAFAEKMAQISKKRKDAKSTVLPTDAADAVTTPSIAPKSDDVAVTVTADDSAARLPSGIDTEAAVEVTAAAAEAS